MSAVLYVFTCDRKHVRIKSSQNVPRCHRCLGDEVPIEDVREWLIEELTHNRLADFSDMIQAQLKTVPEFEQGPAMKYVGMTEKSEGESDTEHRIRALHLKVVRVH